jgi:hypothetical protein
MMKKLSISVVLCLFASSGFAGFKDLLPSCTTKSGLFVGLGGSYNSVKVDQSLTLASNMNVSAGEVLAASGQINGSLPPSRQTQTTFAPEGQLGYFRYVDDTNFWGVKYMYQYLDITASNRFIDSPVMGALTSEEDAPFFVGNVVATAAETRVSHEMLFLGFIGHSFSHVQIYAGAGPALFNTNSHLYGVTSYSDFEGAHIDVTGTNKNFSSSQWMWGAAAQLGVTYYLDPTWFLDFNYTYALSADYSNHYSAPFSTTAFGIVNTGTLSAHANRSVTAQAFNFTINKEFSL